MTVNGTIINSNNNLPLQDVAIFLLCEGGQKFLGKTNVNGDYQINVPYPGIDPVSFCKSGYQTVCGSAVDLDQKTFTMGTGFEAIASGVTTTTGIDTSKVNWWKWAAIALAAVLLLKSSKGQPGG